MMDRRDGQEEGKKNKPMAGEFAWQQMARNIRLFHLSHKKKKVVPQERQLSASNFFYP